MKPVALSNSRIYSTTLHADAAPVAFWDWLVGRRFFNVALKNQGYFILQKDGIAEQPKSPFLPFPTSFDFLSQMPTPLKERGLYVIRTGRGNCVVFDSKRFPFPFGGGICTKPPTSEITVQTPRGYRNLLGSLTKVNEQSFLRLLHFFGIFKQVVYHISGTRNYETGPSGHLSCSFPFWMKDIKRKKIVEFFFEGTADLDECLYPKNTNIVIPIEAKISDGTHCDLGWHKIAFPCYRFIDNALIGRGARELKIFPIYCVYTTITKKVEIFVFPQVKIHKDRAGGFVKKGLVLNEEKQFSPTKVFTSELNGTERYS